jgi:hypothetical protein
MYFIFRFSDGLQGDGSTRDKLIVQRGRESLNCTEHCKQTISDGRGLAIAAFPIAPRCDFDPEVCGHPMIVQR